MSTDIQPGKFFVSVTIEDWHGNYVHGYKFNMNDAKERAVFAEQANNALRNKQMVHTCEWVPAE